MKAKLTRKELEEKIKAAQTQTEMNLERLEQKTRITVAQYT